MQTQTQIKDFLKPTVEDWIEEAKTIFYEYFSIVEDSFSEISLKVEILNLSESILGQCGKETNQICVEINQVWFSRFFNSSFKKEATEILEYVLAHELGHAIAFLYSEISPYSWWIDRHETEVIADTYAELFTGINSSQHEKTKLQLLYSIF